MTDFHIPADFDFGQQFDRLTLTRAMTLEPERALLSMHVDGALLLTRVQGSGAHIYEQQITLPVDRRLGLSVRGHCSCPVGYNCKHVAAALMAFEAFQIRRQKNPSAVIPALADSASARRFADLPDRLPRHAPDQLPGAVRLPAWRADELPQGSLPASTDLPGDLLRWLADFAPANLQAELQQPERSVSATQRLLYGLRAEGTQLYVQVLLGALRKGGEFGAVRRHNTAIAEMLRARPSYVDAADVAALAALLPMSVAAAPGPMLLRARGTSEALQALFATGRVWLEPAELVTLQPSTSPAMRWVAEVLPLTLQWHADATGHWHTGWHTPDDRALQLVLLPEPHALDVTAATLQPARIDNASLPHAVADWLGRMPAVPAAQLPRLIDRLQSLATARHLAIPMPPAHTRDVSDLGELPLQCVLRLSTCPDTSAEASPLDSYSATALRAAKLRQASAQLLFRYAPAGAPLVEFHFPAGAADAAFVEIPATRSLVRFTRDARGEAEALDVLLSQLGLRAWSLSAGIAVDRLDRLSAGRLQAAVLPPALEGKPLLLVARRRDQWPALLAESVPALEAAGWTVEVEPDFPFDFFKADEWQVDVAEAPGHDWFDVGLKVSVGGEQVNLVPLLIGLVQSGWLATEGGAVGASEKTAGEVLVPWPADAPPRFGQPPRQRLLRLPVERIAPLMEWLRAVFRVGDKSGVLRMQRFDVGALDALAGRVKLSAPPSFSELAHQLGSLRRGEGLPTVEPSPEVRAVLRDYQRDGLSWMDFMRRARLGGVLADDMGLGKTLQALALLQGECDAGRADRPSLVIVPTSLIGNWQTEASRFTPTIDVLVLHGPQRMQQFGRIASARLVITSYPLAVRDIEVLAAHEWHYLILDEAQRIKNSRSQAALSLKTLKARHRLCLSGTPLENHLGELWSLIDFVSPGLLGSEAKFREQYRTPIEKRLESGAAAQLARRVRPFILRRTKQQVARELPDKTETLLRVELSGAQADLYETVRATMDKKLRDAIARIGLERSRIMVLEALLKLRQVCCDPRLLKGGDEGVLRPSASAAASAKMELLLDLLPTLVDDGRRVLLFSQFTEMLELIELELAKRRIDYLKLTGASRDRAQIVERFQTGEVPVFLISLKAGGVGLNLTAADTVILYDPWWNPAVEQQAIDRAYRIGQDKPVFVYKLVATGTVEDKMLELQARKAGLADSLLSGVANDAALSADDFDELFKPLAS